jgi:hypothetical protein
MTFNTMTFSTGTFSKMTLSITKTTVSKNILRKSKSITTPWANCIKLFTVVIYESVNNARVFSLMTYQGLIQ